MHSNRCKIKAENFLIKIDQVSDQVGKSFTILTCA